MYEYFYLFIFILLLNIFLVLDQLSIFLPKIEKANEELINDINSGNSNKYNIEVEEIENEESKKDINEISYKDVTSTSAIYPREAEQDDEKIVEMVFHIVYEC